MATITAQPGTTAYDETRARRTGQEKTGVVLTTLVTLFLSLDAVSHLLNVQAVKDANAEIGAPEWFPYVCGAVMAACLVAYLVPRTAILGAVLITAYLGGATAVNLMTEQPAFNVFFAIAVAVVVWAGLWPRDERVKVLYTR